MSSTLKVIVRDIDEEDRMELGEISITDIKPLIELYKAYSAFMPQGVAKFHSAQMIPEEKAVEIIMMYE